MWPPQDAARDAIALAVDRLRERAERIEDAIRQLSFCEAVPEHAKTFALAVQWKRGVVRPRGTSADSPAPADGRTRDGRAHFHARTRIWHP